MNHSGAGWERAGRDDRKFVTALARGLEVLRAFRARDGFLGNQEIAERTGLPKPTVSRLTYTLCELGYLTQVPRTGKYQLAPRAITLGYAALVNLGLRGIARPYMQATADRLSAPVAMGVLDRNRALYLDIAHGSTTYTVQLDVGARIPLAKTAMGWALIAVLAESERMTLFDGLAARHGADWPLLRTRIEQAVMQFDETGFVICEGVWRSDVNAVGAPLVAADGSELYAFNCGGPPHQFSPERMSAEFGPALLRMVRDIDAELTGLPAGGHKAEREG
jgi:DNA-binding IclR family transcriptional regulator